jgi:RNA polymerase-binding transcription factor DksA
MTDKHGKTTAARRRKFPITRSKAATGDILGIRLKPSRVPGKWKKHYNHLIQLRRYLQARQDGLVNDAREEQVAFSLHMADVATDNFDRDFALSRASSQQDIVYEIDAALDRIRDRTYGICELTGKRIEKDRLEAIPWTRFSLEAEQYLENQGVLQRAHLAPHGPSSRQGSGETGSEMRDTEEE